MVEGAGGQRPHRGTAILVLGILGLVTCPICGIIAWVMGNDDLREIDAGRMDPTGRGMVNAGRILGIIATVLILAWILLALLFVAGGIAAS